jgi:hypothetical protein
VTTDREDADVGSLGEEAAKLFAALQDWAATVGHEQVSAAGGALGGLAHGLRDVDAHLATGAAECRYCPVCRLVAMVRGTNPEVRQHLAVAGSALLSAAAAALATSVPEDRRPGRAPVQHIDLDEPAGDGADEQAPEGDPERDEEER